MEKSNGVGEDYKSSGKSEGTKNQTSDEKGDWRIRVKRVRKEDFWVSVEPNDDVETLMKNINMVAGSPGETQKIIWRGKVMRHGRLRDLGLTNGCAIHLFTNRSAPEKSQKPPEGRPLCHNGHPMSISNYSEGGYAMGWVCDRCTRTGFGRRWLCLQCRCDYCQACAGPAPSGSDGAHTIMPHRTPLPQQQRRNHDRSEQMRRSTIAPALQVQSQGHGINITASMGNGTNLRFNMQPRITVTSQSPDLSAISRVNQLHGTSLNSSSSHQISLLNSRQIPSSSRRNHGSQIGTNFSMERGVNVADAKQTMAALRQFQQQFHQMHQQRVNLNQVSRQMQELSRYFACILELDRKTQPITNDLRGLAQLCRELRATFSKLHPSLEGAAERLIQAQRACETKHGADAQTEQLGSFLMNLGRVTHNIGLILSRDARENGNCRGTNRTDSERRAREFYGDRSNDDDAVVAEDSSMASTLSANSSGGDSMIGSVISNLFSRITDSFRVTEAESGTASDEVKAQQGSSMNASSPGTSRPRVPSTSELVRLAPASLAGTLYGISNPSLLDSLNDQQR